MLYKLEIENFFSIRDKQVLDLSIDAKVPDPEGRFAPIFPGSGIRAPKVIAIYGPNASGKTTVLRALSFIVFMACDSVRRDEPGFVGCERFNDEASRERPIRMAVEFGGIVNVSDEVMQRAATGAPVEYGVYRYELEIEVRQGIACRIAREALRQKPNGEGKWQRVFERTADRKLKGSNIFDLGGFPHLQNTLLDNHTVLSSFAKFQHPTAKIFVETARRTAFQVEPMHSFPDSATINYLRAQPNTLTRLNEELSRIDVGVEKLRLEDTATGPLLHFKHSGLELEMPWQLESHGTRAFIKMFPYVLNALDVGGLVAIDEMDAAIHPVLLPELLRWFYDGSGRNPHHAQLWLTCHSASLLDDLDKEEIAICEKDRQGRSRVYSLMDVKVRRDENHYRKYLSGAYGGVPHLG
jgi:energy-coupling factor transporter ATP-binding protein EcfA2